MKNADRPSKHLGRVKFPFAVLDKILKLPPDHHVIHMREGSWDYGTNNVLELMIEGPQMQEVKDGDIIPVVSLEYYKGSKTAKVVRDTYDYIPI